MTILKLMFLILLKTFIILKYDALEISKTVLNNDLSTVE